MKLGGTNLLTPGDVVLHTTSRALLLRISIGSSDVFIFGFHAPDRDHGSVSICNWSRDFICILNKLIPHNACVLSAGDVNGRIGSVPSQAIGSFGLEKENPRVSLFHDLVVSRSWWVPLTFHECANDIVSHTYHKNCKRRIDYFMLYDDCKVEEAQMIHCSELGLETSMDDHSAIAI